MRVTKHTDYALRVLVYLATHPESRVSTQQIARSHRISLNHLQKIVRALGECGFVHLQRGASGGVKLAVDPTAISIGEVVRRLDDGDALVECLRPATNQCVIAPACRLKGALAGAQEAFYAALDPLHLSDVVAGPRASQLRELTAITEPAE